MDSIMVPVFRVREAAASASWYQRLGFEVVGEHRFAPDLPSYIFLRRGGVQLHLSEHLGDAPSRSLVYWWVDDVEPIAREFGVVPEVQPWGTEIELTDPDGNRLRIAKGNDAEP